LESYLDQRTLEPLDGLWPDADWQCSTGDNRRAYPIRILNLESTGMQHRREVPSLEMYPGKVFPAEVEDVIWASGKAQILAGGKLPTQRQIGPPPEDFVVKIRFKGDDPERPLRFGASGIAAIYSGKCDACKFLRQLEIRSESWLNYVYNPF